MTNKLITLEAKGKKMGCENKKRGAIMNETLMIQKYLPQLKISEVKISGGYWQASVQLRYPLSGEGRGWYTVKELIDVASGR